jgi:hypothetical protein
MTSSQRRLMNVTDGAPIKSPKSHCEVLCTNRLHIPIQDTCNATLPKTPIVASDPSVAHWLDIIGKQSHFSSGCRALTSSILLVIYISMQRQLVRQSRQQMSNYSTRYTGEPSGFSKFKCFLITQRFKKSTLLRNHVKSSNKAKLTGYTVDWISLIAIIIWYHDTFDT